MPSFDVERMRAASADVLRSCALSNGAIVAANAGHPDQPPTAVSYHFVWGRDAAHQLEAAHALAMSDGPDIRARFIGWVLARAPGLEGLPGEDSSRLLIKRNHINGPNDRMYNDDRGFQPDNNGSLITALDATRTYPNQNDNRVIRLLANGLAARWDPAQKRFTMRVQDQWENTTVDPQEGGTIFVHSLLAAANGLQRAVHSLQGYATDSEREVWEQTYRQMHEVFFAASSPNTTGPYQKKLAGQPNQLGAGLVLALPHLLPPESPEHTHTRSLRTVKEIGRQLLQLPDGATRYEGDTYSGIMEPGGIEGGAGAWPLLGFAWTRAARRVGLAGWAGSVQSAMEERLREFYERGALPPYSVPEQIFSGNDPRNGKGPVIFGWGSAEWVLADYARSRQHESSSQFAAS